MNRDIKFRGKRVENDEWIYSSSIIIKEVAGVDNVFLNEGGKWLRILPKTVGQYTGLKDKDGNEIYEGDLIALYRDYDIVGGKIVETRAYDLEAVIFTKGGFCTNESDDLLMGNWITEADSEYEVIGNIHDNPELLNQEKLS